jgi:hypothetical protein
MLKNKEKIKEKDRENSHLVRDDEQKQSYKTSKGHESQRGARNQDKDLTD